MRKKLLRFQDNTQQANLIEPGKVGYQTLKGQWAAAYFNNNQAIALELGCGRGDYTVALAKRFPAKNFIGVDVKGARLWAGSTYAVAHKLTNAAFLRAPIAAIADFFAVHEIAALYLPFPDPRKRGKDAKKRLTSPRFLDLYRHILRPGGKIHMKTDHADLFAYTLEVLGAQKDVYELVYTQDLYQDAWLCTPDNIQTQYEQTYLAQGATIKYLCFELGKAV